MKVILDLNPDECLALIQVLERDILFRDLSERIIDDVDRHRHEWANDVRNMGYLRAEDSDWQKHVREAANKPEVREAVANYMYSEGCSCCRDDEAHELHSNKLAALLDVPRYDDDSGNNFFQFTTPEDKPKHKERDDEKAMDES